MLTMTKSPVNLSMNVWRQCLYHAINYLNDLLFGQVIEHRKALDLA